MPDELRMFAGDEKQFLLSVPVGANVTVADPNVVHVNGAAVQSSRVSLDHPFSLQSASAGRTEMKLKLFGAIPLKIMKVDVVPELRVIPGGQSIGVKIKSAGILVVGHHLVPTKNGEISPGEKAGIRLGDLIVEMDGRPIRDVSKVAAIVNEAGKKGRSIELKVRRDGQYVNVPIHPQLDVQEQTYRLGLYIRDSAAGVGTLTFYDPDHGVYGALGHVISDMDTQTPIVVGGGEIVNSTVTSIARSHNGEPGEKHAHFFEDGKVLGNIERNTEFGIFGKMKHPPDGMKRQTLPVAFAEEVREGPAKIYTVVSGRQVEEYDIDIVHVSRQTVPATKGMVIKITDPELLKKTGGIIQGMSGSPIVQDGKLVGAVTHVFVNDPTSGYGCFIEWMLQDAGIVLRPQATDDQAAA